MSSEEVFIMSRKRRSFTDEFKAEVVNLIAEQRRPVRQVCQELDLTESSVRRWVQRVEIDAGHGAEGALTTAEREELRRLRREVKEVRMERDLLKKATAFFAKESS
jgi:transposase|tara:strand:- start:1110 stop:1427 length:318 start_codon:yes stop_codon:yes gene_type:complete